MQEHLVKERSAAVKTNKRSVGSPSSHHGFDLRTALDWLRTQGDLIETDTEVDPDLEVTGLQKHMDGGCPILFGKVKGKPHHRVVTNLFGDMNVINKMFGWTSDAERVRKLAYALSHPLMPEIIAQDDAPVQQHIVKNPKKVNDYLVPIRHTTYEPELTVGSGIRCVSPAQFDGGTDLGYNRMNFRWGNVGTFQISPGSHMWQVANKYYKADRADSAHHVFRRAARVHAARGRRLRLRHPADGLQRDRHCGSRAGLADPHGQVPHRGRLYARRCRAGARRLCPSARPPLRDQGVGGGRHPGPLPFSPGMGRLYGQGLQGADLPCDRGHHAGPQDEANHLCTRRAYSRRSQYRHLGARGRYLRAVQPAAARASCRTW